MGVHLNGIWSHCSETTILRQSQRRPNVCTDGAWRGQNLTTLFALVLVISPENMHLTNHRPNLPNSHLCPQACPCHAHLTTHLKGSNSLLQRIIDSWSPVSSLLLFMAVSDDCIPYMSTRSKTALANRSNRSNCSSKCQTESGQAHMAGEQHGWSAAGAAQCQQCESLWKRALASLEATLPAQHYQTVCQTFRDVWQADRGFVDDVQSEREQPRLELVLSHDCASVACTDPNCALCCNSTSRRCSDLLLPKYLVRDPLVPACGAPAAVTIQRRNGDGTSSETLAENDFRRLPAFVFQVLSVPFWFLCRVHAQSFAPAARLRHAPARQVHWKFPPCPTT
jgi:hypothetical protein